MKLMLGNTPVKKIMIHNDTQDATMVASDLQAGVTCYAKGQKVIGTGKSFEFAQYGVIKTNVQQFVPTLINIVEISGIDYLTKSSIDLLEINNVDFATEQVVGVVMVDNIEYPITVKVEGYILTFNCEKTVKLNFFYGKDNYV